MKTKHKFLSLVLILIIFSSTAFSKKHREEKVDRFKKWLNDVHYIITDKEKAVFKKLKTPKEKEKFIEEFWKRRDPDPRTPENEYKEEFYRRIAYADDHFSAGLRGSLTDRGMIYIKFGPPDEIISHPSGGRYFRQVWEGSGSTVTYPFEIWRYRYIPGIGQDVEIEFVDTTFSGNYEIALSSEDKDMLKHVPGVGLTKREEYGLTEKRWRDYLPIDGARLKDQPFERLDLYAKLQMVPKINFNDLRTKVFSKVVYNQIPYSIKAYYFYLDKSRAVVPIALEVPDRYITFEKKFGMYVGKVELYTVVRTLEGMKVAEYEDKIRVDFKKNEFASRNDEKSVYQKIIILPPGRYKISTAIKDVFSKNVSTTDTGVYIPPLKKDSLTCSDLIIARSVDPVDLNQPHNSPFVLGVYKVIPNVSQNLKKGDLLGVYFHVYNFALNPESNKPDISVKYVISKSGKPVVIYTDLKGESVRYISKKRLVLVKGIKLNGLTKGTYRLKVTVSDNLSGKKTYISKIFTYSD